MVNNIKNNNIEQKIYQNGFFLFLGILLGMWIGYHINIKTAETKNNSSTIEIQKQQPDTVYKDTAGMKKISKKISEKNIRDEFKRYNIKHPDIVYAQARLETANFTSDVCIKNNNLFGLTDNNGYMVFDDWRESVRAYKEMVQYKYKGGSYYKFLKELPYAEDPTYCDKLKDIV